MSMQHSEKVQKENLDKLYTGTPKALHKNKVDLKRIFYSVLEHFSDMSAYYFMFATMLFTLWLFFLSVAINKALMIESTFTIDELSTAADTIMELAILFFILCIVGIGCRIWGVMQEVKIKNIIKKYKIGVIK